MLFFFFLICEWEAKLLALVFTPDVKAIREAVQKSSPS